MESWYVLKTKLRKEEQVSSVLEERRVEHFLPLLKRAKPTRTGRRSIPLFSSYMFVHFGIPSDEFVRTRSAPGVIGLVAFDGEAASVPADIVESIRERVDVENSARYPSPFRVGQRVVITNGPFKDIEAIFDGKLTSAGRAHVLIDLLGKHWRVQVNLRLLTRVG